MVICWVGFLNLSGSAVRVTVKVPLQKYIYCCLHLFYATVLTLSKQQNCMRLSFTHALEVEKVADNWSEDDIALLGLSAVALLNVITKKKQTKSLGLSVASETD